MRRFATILLLLAFSSLVSAPLFAISTDTDGSMPACCRRDGKHHCMARMTTTMEQSGRHASTIAEKCPCLPSAITTAQSYAHALPLATIFYSGLLKHPACFAQTEARYRISFDRSSQKRGPPVVLL
jgi:hypothetical protein